MKLYFSPGACSLASHIGLREVGAKFDLERVDLKTHKTVTGEDFYAINPKGYVPTLALDGGGILTENAAVLPYIADLKPESGLAPQRGTAERYRLFEWLGFIGSEVHKNHKPFFSADASEKEKSAAMEKLRERYKLIEQTLANQPFLLGNRFSVADAYLFVMLTWMTKTGLDMSQWPSLQSFYERVGERDSVKQAREAEKAA
ncbi:MAG TPA: glutathione transferase GstA [Burkholderiales bacterium]|nr:glutathione transferase GstA [Burkholderiales bacterium]